jgi:outer membrane murein-binding lipoprotein Lpp
MAIRCKRMACVALAGMLLYGCSTTPRFNNQFGASVRANVAAQVLDPAAAANTNPAAGMEGAAAAIAHERYENSFKEPEKPISGLVVSGVGSK